MTADGDNARSAALVRRFLPDVRFDDPRYLDWQYEANPVGRAFAMNLDVEGERVAHLGAVPQALRDARRRERFLLIVNIVTVPERQRAGVMATLLARGAPQAIEQGYVGGYGVTNESSTGMALRSFGATFVGNLPVVVVPPRPVSTRGVRTLEVTPALLGSAEFEDLTADLDDHPAQDWVQCWTPEVLRWRLAMPTARYHLHVAADLLAVTRRVVARGVPLTAVCKLVPRGGRSGPLSPHAVIAAACRHHRTPVAVYAGFNAHVPVRGLAVPRRLRPSPLNVACLSISEAMDPETFRFDTFELLDFDAL